MDLEWQSLCLQLRSAEATCKVPDAKVRVKAKIGCVEAYLYADVTDLATGLGKPREIELDKVNADPHTANEYKQELESSP
jgi:hypothetical protein